MAKHGKKKVPITCADKVLMTLCCIIALLLLVICVPFLMWRQSNINPVFMYRYPMARYWSLFSISTNTGVWMSWLAMRTSLCAQMSIFMAPNMLNQIISAAASIPLLGKTTVGGAAMGCQYWQNCKNECAQRCNFYGTMAYTGLACTSLNLLGIIACFAVPAFLAWERDMAAKKKKKHLANAKFNTMVGCCVAGSIPLVSSLTWFSTSAYVLSSLQANSYYPYAGASVGLMMSFVASGLSGVVIAVGVNRHLELIGYQKKSKKTDDDDEDQDEIDEGTDAGPPGGMPGQMMPPGGYGAPPMGYGAPPMGAYPGGAPGMMPPGGMPAMMPPGPQ